VIDDVTTAVEGVHKSVPTCRCSCSAKSRRSRRTLDEVKVTQDQTIGAVYGLVRSIQRAGASTHDEHRRLSGSLSPASA